MKQRLDDCKKDNASLENQLMRAKKEAFDYKVKYETLQKKFVELEIQNEKLTDSLRYKEGIATDLQSRLEGTLEELTILQIEAQESKELDLTEKQRMHDRLNDIQDDLNHSRFKQQNHKSM